MAIFSSLTIGVQAVRSFQTAIQTTAHNIANVNTPGFSRQRVMFQTETSDFDGRIQVGRGVQLGDVERLRDVFLDIQIRTESSNLGQSETSARMYRLVETAFNEPSDAALSEGLSQFWDAWQEVANNPTELSIRANLKAKSESLAATFNRVNKNLTDLQKQANSEIISEINTINGLTEKLNDINAQLRTLSTETSQPNDLLDRRDQTLKEISKKINISVTIGKLGQANVQVNGSYLVDGSGQHLLETNPISGNALGLVDLRFKESKQALSVTSGNLKGLLDTRDTVIPDYQSRLNSLASTLVTQINTTHRGGMGLDGAVQIKATKTFTGTLSANKSFGLNGTTIQLFSGDNLTSIMGRINAQTATTGVTASISSNTLILTPAVSNPQTVNITSDTDSVMLDLGIVNNFFSGTTAEDIKLADNINNDLNSIAASSTGAPGDNANALAIDALRDALTMNSSSQTFEDFYRTALTDLGSSSQASLSKQDSQSLLLDQLNALQESTAGVSLEEEATKLLQFQRSFEAATRLIQVSDEVLEALLNI